MKKRRHDTSRRFVHYDVVLSEELKDVVFDAVDAVWV